MSFYTLADRTVQTNYQRQPSIMTLKISAKTNDGKSSMTSAGSEHDLHTSGKSINFDGALNHAEKPRKVAAMRQSMYPLVLII